MNLKAMLKPFVQSLVRRRNPVIFGDLEGLEPASRGFGLERGEPIDRRYIAEFLSANLDVIRGRALEIAEIRYLASHGQAVDEKYVLAADAGAINPADADGVIVADLCDPSSLPQAEFDCFVCTQTLNFIYDAPAAIRGAYAALRPGGVLIGTVSGLAQISRYDADRWGDYWRFTPQSLSRLLAASFGDQVQIRQLGNLPAAIALLQGLSVEDLPDPRVLAPADPDYPLILGFTATRT